MAFFRRSKVEAEATPLGPWRIVVRMALALMLLIIGGVALYRKLAPLPPIHDHYTVFDMSDRTMMLVADVKGGFVNRQKSNSYSLIVNYGDAGREAKLEEVYASGVMQALAENTARDFLAWVQVALGGSGAAYTGDPIYVLRRSERNPEDWDLTATFGETVEVVPSFFHRVSDPRVEQVDDLLQVRQLQVLPVLTSSGASTMAYVAPPFPALALEQMKTLSEGMVHDHPDDPAYRMLLANALAAAHDEMGLAHQLDTIRPQLAAMPGLRTAFARAEASLHAMEWSARGINLADYLDANFSSTATLAMRVKAMPGVLEQEGFGLDVPTLEPDQYWRNDHPFTDNARAMTTIAVEEMFEGRRHEALELLVATYYACELVLKSQGIEGARYAFDAENTVLDGLETYLLDACETEDELREAWGRLEWLNDKRSGIEKDSLSRRHAFLRKSEREYLTNFGKLLATRRQLLRMAAAARLHVMASGELPKAAADFSALLPTLPGDPYTTETTALRFSTTGTTCTLYSVGPDGKDDGGKIEFDAVHYWVRGSGDVVLRVPLKRKFPFSRDGVSGNSTADVARQFPNGLPLDPFMEPARELNVSTSGPLVIYSRGPYGRSHQSDAIMINLQGAGDVAYDPTNGSVSRGDIAIPVLGRQP